MKKAFLHGEMDMQSLGRNAIRNWLIKCLESLGIDYQGRGVGHYTYVMSYLIRTLSEEQYKNIESIGILTI